MLADFSRRLFRPRPRSLPLSVVMLSVLASVVLVTLMAPVERVERVVVRDAKTLDAGPTGKTKTIAVSNAAATRLQYASGAEHLWGVCNVETAGLNVYLVESGASSTAQGQGPYCDTCTLGPSFVVGGTDYARTSAGSGNVRCRFYDAAIGAAIAPAGSGGASSVDIHLDGSNAGSASALNFPAQVTTGNGSAASMGIGFTSNTGLGFFRRGADSMGQRSTSFMVHDTSTFPSALASSQWEIQREMGGARLVLGVANSSTSGVAESHTLAGSAANYVSARFAAYGSAAGIDNLPSGTVAFLGGGSGAGAQVTSVRMISPHDTAPLIFERNDYIGTRREFMRIANGVTTFNLDNADQDLVVDTDTIDGAFQVDGATGDTYFKAHLRSVQTGATAIAAGSTTCSSTSISGVDGVGSASGQCDAGEVMTIDFAVAWANAPVCSVTPSNTEASSAQLFASATTTQLAVTARVGNAANANFTYLCIGQP